MTGEVVASRKHRKFIPVIRRGSWSDAAPSWLKGKLYVDLTGDPYSEDHYQDLLATLHNSRKGAPPLGPTPPTFRSGAILTPSPDYRTAADEPIRITGIIVDEVGRPRNDGSRGSALYKVPFQLSRRPSADWAREFVKIWNSPPQFTPMHRPGIARIVDAKVVLDGTTIEEVDKYHRETLKVVLDRTNQIIAEAEERAKRRAEATRQNEEAHDAAVRRRAEQIRFDD